MPLRRGDRVAIGMLALWLVVWTAAILIVLWALGGRLLEGDLGAAPFLILWLAAAGFGIWAAARKLRRLVTGERAPPEIRKGHVWKDDLSNR